MIHILHFHRSTNNFLNKNELRLAWTLFSVCLCYIIFVLPITFIYEVDLKIHSALFCVYWLQYSLNFFLYAARIEQYRKAYLFFLKEVCTVFIVYLVIPKY